MKKALIGASVLLTGGAGTLGIMAMNFEEKIRPNTFIGLVGVGDLTREEAAKKIRIWWENEKSRPITVEIPQSRLPAQQVTTSKLGYTVDDEKSVANLPLDSFWDSSQRSISNGDAEKKTFPVLYKQNGADVSWLKSAVKQAVGEPRPARVTFEAGVVKRHPEVSSYTVDMSQLSEAINQALTGDGTLRVPIQEAPKTIPDDKLAMIKEVVAEYSTRFPVGQQNRNANLSIASGKLDGFIMMPGDVFSFNKVVGQRTMDEGYRIAPVLASGRHDVGIGGGICQVSGTLFNAVSLSNLKIVQRQNHSMPVAYLPVGRDATVSYPSLDFKFQNNTDGPIAISRTFTPGKLTFRILGTKMPGTQVSIETGGHRSWANGVQYVNDSSLPPGKQKVVERGSSGHAVTTYRIVKVNGQVVKREVLTRSNYSGGKRIIAINRSAPKPAAPKSDASMTPAPAPQESPSEFPETVPPPQF